MLKAEVQKVSVESSSDSPTNAAWKISAGAYIKNGWPIRRPRKSISRQRLRSYLDNNKELESMKI